jgi:hypothetical protein
MERLNFFEKGDSQLVDVRIIKVRSENPGIGVKLYATHDLEDFDV